MMCKYYDDDKVLKISLEEKATSGCTTYVHHRCSLLTTLTAPCSYRYALFSFSPHTLVTILEKTPFSHGKRRATLRMGEYKNRYEFREAKNCKRAILNVPNKIESLREDDNFNRHKICPCQ
ncbi:hypothetical protein AVEN_21630-1 [Araneus ventricosus]|uniref:Uncharacterized protein n=1 Tax=Araneus ventricosus TaxID=182803 RepID=A0A4Y2P9A2_ARAVE|nr:hypothetical protein AVEN_21630-1 [Araneus ventricosus]